MGQNRASLAGFHACPGEKIGTMYNTLVVTVESSPVQAGRHALELCLEAWTFGGEGVYA